MSGKMDPFTRNLSVVDVHSTYNCKTASKADVRNGYPFFSYADAAHQWTSIMDVRSILVMEQYASGRLF